MEVPVGYPYNDWHLGHVLDSGIEKILAQVIQIRYKTLDLRHEMFVQVRDQQCLLSMLLSQIFYNFEYLMKAPLLFLFSLIVTSSLSQTKEEQDIINLCRKKFKWMVETKLDSLRDILDDRLTYTHSSGWVQTKTDFLTDFTNGRLTYQSIDLQELKARVYAGAAIVNGRGKFSVTANNMQVTYDLMFTETYVLIDKKWKLASRHANKMQ
jgi:hypothetical protein